MKRHPMVAFWVLGLLLSWAAWVPMILAREGRVSLPVSLGQLQVFGAYGLAVAALLVTFFAGGAAGLQSLFGRLLIWRVGWRWYAVALLLPAGISVTMTLLNLMRGGELPDYSQPPIFYVALPAAYSDWNRWAMLAPLFFKHLLFGTCIGEELGWRGFVLPRLQEKYSPFWASICIGVLWGVWQLPMIVLPAPNPWAFVMLILGAVPAAIIITWLFNKTQGSLLLVLLFNAATKVTDLFVTPSVAPAYFQVLAFWLVAACILAGSGLKGLAPAPLLPSLCRCRATLPRLDKPKPDIS